MVRTSQKLFPAKVRKGLPERVIHNIRVVQFRLDPLKMNQNYDTTFLPILGKDDPLAIKMILGLVLWNSVLSVVLFYQTIKNCRRQNM